MSVPRFISGIALMGLSHCKQSLANFSIASGLTFGWTRERYSQNNSSGSGTVSMLAVVVSFVPPSRGLVATCLKLNSSSRRHAVLEGGC